MDKNNIIKSCQNEYNYFSDLNFKFVYEKFNIKEVAHYSHFDIF